MLLSSLRLLTNYTTHAGAKIGVLANELSGQSVTVVSVVRLTFLIKGAPYSDESIANFANILIWSSVEINVGIICGQLMIALLHYF